MKSENLRPPRPTQGVIDAHCHIYPDPIARKAVQAVDRFYEGVPADHYDGTIQMLLTSGSNAGITHFIVHSVATKPEQVSHINRFIAQSAEASEGRFTGLGTLHPDSTDLRRDFEELESLGLHGVKLHPDIQRFRVDGMRAMAIFEMCEDRGLPVCVHTGDARYDYSNPNRVVNVLRAFPRLQFIGAHLGGWSVWDRAARVLPDYPNIWVDTCSSLYALKPQAARDLIRAYGSKRTMFGTDYPMWPQKRELEMLARLELEEGEYEDIFWNTCAGLFGI